MCVRWCALQAAAGPSGAEPKVTRGPTLLVLDGRLQQLPWESSPSLGHLRYTVVVLRTKGLVLAINNEECIDLPSASESLPSGGPLLTMRPLVKLTALLLQHIPHAIAGVRCRRCGAPAAGLWSGRRRRRS
jgi:hypothetical protein